MAVTAIEQGKAVFRNEKGQKVFVSPDEGPGPFEERLQSAVQRAVDENPNLSSISPEEGLSQILPSGATAILEAGNAFFGGAPAALANLAGLPAAEILQAGRQIRPTEAGLGQAAGLLGSAVAPGGLIGVAENVGKGFAAARGFGKIGQGFASGLLSGGLAGLQLEGARISGETKPLRIEDAAGRILKTVGETAAISGGFGILAGGVSTLAAKGSARAAKWANKKLGLGGADDSLRAPANIFEAELDPFVAAQRGIKQQKSGLGAALDEAFAGLPQGQKIQNVITELGPEGEVARQWLKTVQPNSVPKDVVGKVASAFTYTLSRHLAPFGPVGRAISGLVGKFGAEMVGANLLRIWGKISPSIVAAKGLGRSGPALPAMYQAITGINKDQQQRLEDDYLGSASEAISSNVIDPSAVPGDLYVSAAAKGNGLGAERPDLRATIAAAKLQTPEQHAEAALKSYRAAGFTDESAASWSEFHRRRIQMLSDLKIDDPISLSRSKKMFDAIIDPGSALRRIENRKQTPEDIVVMRSLLPETSGPMSELASSILEMKFNKAMPIDTYVSLAQLSTGRERQKYSNFVQNLQNTYAEQEQAQAQQQQRASTGRPINLRMPDTSTTLQRLQTGP